jgi:hypothetical protein
MVILKQDRKPILAAVPSCTGSEIIKGISYIETSYNTDKWRIYEFAKLLELEESIWWEEGH